MTDETLRTTFCLVEQAVNNHPLTPVSDDPNELEALTPNHFLLDRFFQALPCLVPGDEPNLRRRYTKAQAYANVIWVRLMKDDYVPLLHKRGTWNKHSDVSLNAGDFVWVVDSPNSRGCYPLSHPRCVMGPIPYPAPPSCVHTPAHLFARWSNFLLFWATMFVGGGGCC